MGRLAFSFHSNFSHLKKSFNEINGDYWLHSIRFGANSSRGWNPFLFVVCFSKWKIHGLGQSRCYFHWNSIEVTLHWFRVAHFNSLCNTFLFLFALQCFIVRNALYKIMKICSKSNRIGVFLKWNVKTPISNYVATIFPLQQFG